MNRNKSGIRRGLSRGSQGGVSSQKSDHPYLGNELANQIINAGVVRKDKHSDRGTRHNSPNQGE
jgi:hypothetical protein